MAFVDAAEIAEEIVALEHCPPVRPHLCPTLVRDRARNPLDRWPTWDVTARLYRLRNVVLDCTHKVLLHEGRIVAQSRYLQPDAAMASLAVRLDDLRYLDAGRPWVTAADHWPENFYHWMAHTLPVLHAVLEREPIAGAGLLLPPLQPWQQQSLALMGASHLPVVALQPGSQVFLPQADYYDLVAGSLDFAISPLSRAAYARLPGVKNSHGRLRLYVDRSGAGNRRLGNEAALAEALRGRGFTIVRPATLTFAEQAALFGNASMVVGMLGAGLANIAHCRPGTVVYELIPRHHLNPCFMVMAQQQGLAYWADMFDSGQGGNDHVADWTQDIDIPAVLQRVADLEPLAPQA